MTNSKGEYFEPSYETISDKQKRHLAELFGSSILNGLTEDDFDDTLAIIRRVIDRLEADDANK